MARDYFSVEVDTLRQTKDSMADALSRALTELNQLSSTVQTLNATWKGPAHSTFLAVFQKDFAVADACCDALKDKIKSLEQDEAVYRSCEDEVMQRVRRL